MSAPIGRRIRHSDAAGTSVHDFLCFRAKTIVFHFEKNDVTGSADREADRSAIVFRSNAVFDGILYQRL